MFFMLDDATVMPYSLSDSTPEFHTLLPTAITLSPPMFFIAEALAEKIAAGNVPYRLKNHDVCLLDLTALVAGTQFRGQFESRVLGLLNDVKAKGNVILVIDEVHNIVGVGDAEGSMNAANILKPALSRGEIQVIGATTLTEYRKYIEKDTALERRFQPVMVNEPSVSDTVDILRGIKKYYED